MDEHYVFMGANHLRQSLEEAALSGKFFMYGPHTIGFILQAGAGGLRMLPVSWRVLGIPLPRLLWPRIDASECARDGRFHFDVATALPVTITSLSISTSSVICTFTVTVEPVTSTVLLCGLKPTPV